MASTVRVVGLADLQRAFALVDRRLSKDLRSALESAAEPVRRDAESLALSQIPKMTLPWSRMRTGVTRGLVYVAPVERGRRTKSGALGRKRYSRPNLKDLLLDRSMDPALERNRDKVMDEVEDAMTDLAKAWARV